MLVLAILLVFAVLVLQFGSFRQTLIILATMPLALIGIVVNDAIVMIDTMNRHVADGLDLAAARGASDRLRPIISTTLTTIVGLVPLAINDPMWRPLCYAIIFGLTVATITSLVVVPCLYVLFTPRTRVVDRAT